MNKFLLIACILFTLSACVKPVEKVEQYQVGSVINEGFLVAVLDNSTETIRVDFVPLNEYQADQQLAKPKYKLFQTYGRFEMNPCIANKVGCSFDGTAGGGEYKVNSRGFFGEGATSIYKIQNHRVIPVSFSYTQ